MNDLDIAVVVPTLYPNKNLETFKCINNQTIDVEFIRVDGRHVSITRAREKGVERAKEQGFDVVGFTDDDAYPHHDWVENAVKHFDKPNVAGVEGYTYGGLERAHDWGYMTVNMFYNVNVFKEVNGFDKQLSGWRADTDLAWRIMDKGYRIVYEKNAKVQHPTPPRSRFSIPKEIRFINKHLPRYVGEGVFLTVISDYFQSLAKQF